MGTNLRLSLFTTIATLLLGSAASSEPMPEGVVLMSSGILCDKLDQLVEMTTAGFDSWEAGNAVYAKYLHMPNDVGDPTCGNSQVMGKIIANTALPQIVMKDGVTHYKAWAQEVENNNSTTKALHPSYFLLHLEKVDEDIKPSSMPPSGREGMRSYILLPQKVPWVFRLLGI